MKITLEGDGPDDEAKLTLMLNASAMQRALWEIGQEVFRPARKHGYPDPEIRKFLDEKTLTERELGDREELVHALEKKFYEILDNNKVNLDD
jgi:hypothetical protein